MSISLRKCISNPLKKCIYSFIYSKNVLFVMLLINNNTSVKILVNRLKELKKYSHQFSKKFYRK